MIAAINPDFHKALYVDDPRDHFPIDEFEPQNQEELQAMLDRMQREGVIG